MIIIKVREEKLDIPIEEMKSVSLKYGLIIEMHNGERYTISSSRWGLKTSQVKNLQSLLVELIEKLNK